MAHGTIGQIKPFDYQQGDNWPTYIGTLEQYFKANNITDAKKVAILLTAVVLKTYSLIRKLLVPAKPADKVFSDIMYTVRDHLNLKPLAIAERFKFHQRTQKEGKSVAKYLASLRKLAEHCEFNEFLDQALQDKLVCGLRNKMTQ